MPFRMLGWQGFDLYRVFSAMVQRSKGADLTSDSRQFLRVAHMERELTP